MGSSLTGAPPFQGLNLETDLCSTDEAPPVRVSTYKLTFSALTGAPPFRGSTLKLTFAALTGAPPVRGSTLKPSGSRAVYFNGPGEKKTLKAYDTYHKQVLRGAIGAQRDNWQIRRMDYRHRDGRTDRV